MYMQGYSTTTWGYKILSDKTINFYHVLLPKIQLTSLQKKVNHLQDIRLHTDGSITLTVTFSSYTSYVVQQLVSVIEEDASPLLETPIYYYKITNSQRQLLSKWPIAFLGCLAILLSHDKHVGLLVRRGWELIDSYIGGLYLPPFTMLLYTNYPRIIHPISYKNIDARDIIEQTTSSLVEKIANRAEEAQKEYEGLAMLSLVEEKTGLSPKVVARLIDEKTLNLKNPKFLPIFTLQK